MAFRSVHGEVPRAGTEVSFLRKQESSSFASSPWRERPGEPKAQPSERIGSVIPTEAGIQERNNGIPTFVGMTYKEADPDRAVVASAFLLRPRCSPDENRPASYGLPQGA